MGNYQRNDGPYGPMPNGSVHCARRHPAADGRHVRLMFGDRGQFGQQRHAGAQRCQIKNAQPTEGLDSEKAVRKAERLTDVHKGESRWSVCSTLMGEYDEQTATWALGQVDVDWGRNALRYAELNDLKDEDPADDNGNEMITMRLKIAGFTQQQIDYAKAHWDETIGDGDTEDATPQHDEHGSDEDDDSL